MRTDTGFQTHVEAVMGTIVGITSPHVLPPQAVAEATARLHDADRVFSTWNNASPISRLRRGEVSSEDLDAGDAEQIARVLERCAIAREITGGAFDPWAMPGGVDPTGLVKGWAVGRAVEALTATGVHTVMVNAGGDIEVRGHPGGRAWRVGIRHPGQPNAFVAVVRLDAAIATSGDYERPGELIDPATGRAARVAASATVTGTDLDLVDALATGLAVGGRTVLAAIDNLPGYEAHLITLGGRHYATPGMSLAPAG